MTTQADLDQLKKLIASGVKRTMRGSRTVELQELKAMQAAAAEMELELAKQQPGAPTPIKTHRFRYNPGY